ncbi:hypothetical protein OG497_37735 [Streptomyces sp. NBC_01242]|uniref:hypothetical protein n=1 Tax=Streptomyces sp. NBC_01242 TaxID=2903795 RepID=UPI00225647DA|nr:hypothetical protein [Streptomyces sp. NBC_01242]MCX4799600.1 hypothetical protein [Streptomyces sp. NBC_01242]
MSKTNLTATGYTPAQNRAVRLADPKTGIITGRRDTLRALVPQKLATLSKGGEYVLSPLGWDLHDQLNGSDPKPVAALIADFNHGRRNISQLVLGPERTCAVQAAWAGVIAQRALIMDDPEHRPMPWEFQQPMRAVSLALESAGLQPGAIDHSGRCVRDGYQVRRATRADSARVSFSTHYCRTQIDSPRRQDSRVLDMAHDRALNEYRIALDQRGWACTRRQSAQGTHPFLIATPCRA